MFSFIKKLAKSIFALFKKPRKATKTQVIVSKASELVNKFIPKKEVEAKEVKPDILKEISLFILKEFGFGKYINFALSFAKFLK